MSIIRKISASLQLLYPANEARAIALSLCGHITGLSSTQLLSDNSLVLSPLQNAEIEHAMQRLNNHEPLQYILGETSFYALPFKVDHRVLIPRPETEELVEWIVNDRKNQRCSIIDLCTGSGCIAIALAKNLAESLVLACDISEDALAVAKANNTMNDAGVSFFTGDVLSGNVDEQLPEADVIVSNPPYVMENEKSTIQPNVLDFEPELALFVPDNDPLVFYKAIGKIALEKLRHEGALYVEINRAKGAETVDLYRRMGFGFVELRNDLYGNARMVKAIKN